MSVLVRCEQLTQVYRAGQSEVLALQGLDLAVTEGEMLGVVGGSGSGKSTLLQVVAGLLRPAGGRVTVGELDLGAASASALDSFRRNDVGFVWQDPSQNLLPHLSAVQNVAMALELSGRAGATSAARELLARVGLADRGDARAGELSGGEQQRVSLASAVVHRPRLLLADEPTGALDRVTTSEVFALMRELGEATGVTQLIVSHDPELARHVDRVVRIRDGRVAAEQRWIDGSAAADPGGGDVAEALVVDSIGRLQLTEEMLDSLGTSRVQAEVVDGEVHIRPAGHQGVVSDE